MNVVGNIFCRPGDQGEIWKLGKNGREGHSNDPADPKTEATLLRHGNFDFVSGKTRWDEKIENHVLPDSLYLKGKPAFFGDLPWPPFGPDRHPMVGQLPAKERYLKEFNKDEDPKELDKTGNR